MRARRVCLPYVRGRFHPTVRIRVRDPIFFGSLMRVVIPLPNQVEIGPVSRILPQHAISRPGAGANAAGMRTVKS